MRGERGRPDRAQKPARENDAALCAIAFGPYKRKRLALDKVDEAVVHLSLPLVHGPGGSLQRLLVCQRVRERPPRVALAGSIPGTCKSGILGSHACRLSAAIPFSAARGCSFLKFAGCFSSGSTNGQTLEGVLDHPPVHDTSPWVSTTSVRLWGTLESRTVLSTTEAMPVRVSGSEKAALSYP